jgi:hypothetical protein
MTSSRNAARVGNVINIGLGLWLAVSIFVWPHFGAARINSLVTGVVIAILAAAALVEPACSAADTLPAIWLIGTSLWLAHGEAATAFHNAAIGALVIFASTTPLVAFPRTAYEEP